MGYSCSVKADLTLEAIRLLSEFDIESEDYKYFIEIGKENADGSITGTVFEQGERIDAKSWKCSRKGSFKINSQGKVVRFPGLSKNLWGVVEIASIESYDKIYSI